MSANDDRNRRLSRGDVSYRIALARVEHSRLRDTHVVVGDHDPEPREFVVDGTLSFRAARINDIGPR